VLVLYLQYLAKPVSRAREVQLAAARPSHGAGGTGSSPLAAAARAAARSVESRGTLTRQNTLPRWATFFKVY